MNPLIQELREVWKRLPYRVVVVGLLVAWWALFQHYGAAQLHWLPTPSLFAFMNRMLGTAVQLETDDALGVWMPWLFLALLVMRRRELTPAGPPADRWAGVLVVAGAAVLHVVSFSVQQVGLSFLAFLLGAYGLTGVVWGRDWLRRFWFPFVVLLFMIPIVQYLDAPTFWLRHFSATAATWIGQNLFNLKLFRQATMVSALDANNQPIFQFDVVDACSGIRSLKVIALLTVIFGYLQFETAWRRWLLLALAPFLAVAGNVCRLVATFIVGEAFGQDAASKFETNFGFVTFAVAIGGLILAAHWLREKRGGPEVAPEQRPTSAPPADREFEVGELQLRPVLVTLLLVGVTAGFLHYRGPRQRLGAPGVRLSHDALLGGDNAQSRTNGVTMPERLTGYDSLPVPITTAELQFLPSDTTFGRRVYRDFSDGFEAMLSVVVMGTDRSSLHRPEQCLGSQGISITRRETLRIPLPGTEVEILRCDGEAPLTAGENSPQRAVFAYLFWSADRQTSSHTRRHLLTMQDLVMRGEMPRWAGIQCFTRCRPGEEDATFEKMKRLLTVALPAVRVPATGTGG